MASAEGLPSAWRKNDHMGLLQSRAGEGAAPVCLKLTVRVGKKTIPRSARGWLSRIAASPVPLYCPIGRPYSSGSNTISELCTETLKFRRATQGFKWHYLCACRPYLTRPVVAIEVVRSDQRREKPGYLLSPGCCLSSPSLHGVCRTFPPHLTLYEACETSHALKTDHSPSEKSSATSLIPPLKSSESRLCTASTPALIPPELLVGTCLRNISAFSLALIVNNIHAILCFANLISFRRRRGR